MKEIIEKYDLKSALQEGLRYPHRGVGDFTSTGGVDDMKTVCLSLSEIDSTFEIIEKYGADMFKMMFQKSPGMAIYHLREFAEKR